MPAGNHATCPECGWIGKEGAGSEVVIARFGSSRRPPSYLLDPILVPTIDAIVGALAAT